MKKRPTFPKKSQAPCDSSIINQVAIQLDLFGGAAPAIPVSPPRYPSSRDSVIAHVLVLLLEGRHLTSDDVKAECGSSRAAHHAYALTKIYDWPIQTEPWYAGTKDGRVANIDRYFLEPAVITLALVCGAKGFIQETLRARATLRQSAPEKHRQAENRNTGRLGCVLQ